MKVHTRRLFEDNNLSMEINKILKFFSIISKNDRIKSYSSLNNRVWGYSSVNLIKIRSLTCYPLVKGANERYDFNKIVLLWSMAHSTCSMYALLFLFFWPVAMTWKLNYQDLINCDSNREGKKHNVFTTSKYRIWILTEQLC